jgi:glutamine amidotransferase
MCRIFGFRSVLDSRVHRSLLSAENALALQSEKHPDGWGVAYYVAGAPHLIRSAGTAHADATFRQVGAIVSSQTVLAHIRKATQGQISPLNCHPFQYGRWVMAHNGDVPRWPEVRPRVLEAILPRFQRYLLGETDSEVIFHLFLTRLFARADVARADTPIEAVIAALRETVAIIREETAKATSEAPLLTLVVTDGATMVAHQGGKPLLYSTYKQRCSERDSCPFHAPECEAETRSGKVNHLVLSSEPLHGENVWTELPIDGVVGVDASMRLFLEPKP